SREAIEQALQRAKIALQGGRGNEAERIAADVLAADPKHAGALEAYGCALLMQGHAKAAVAPLEQAARTIRSAAAAPQLAIALRRSGRNDEALSRLKRAVKREPPYAAAFHELGFLLFSLERHDEAIEALRQGLTVAPMMPQLSTQLGYVFLRRGQFGSAASA